MNRAIFQPADVGILLSYRCQSACAHCLYNCSPEWQDWMSLEDLQCCLTQVAAWWHPFQLHFTGGEPFLNFPLLLQAVELASGMGIASYVETNAGWCLNEEVSLDYFQQLQNAGMAAVLVSCSPFHAAHIPLARTMRAISSAVTVFGMQRVWVYRSEWIGRIRQLSVDSPVPLDAWQDQYGAETGRMLWDGYGLMGGGRAGSQLGHLARRFPPESFRWDNCQRELLHAPHSHLDLYGNIIPGFCSGISLGNWRELPALIARMSTGMQPGLVENLVREGPYSLYQMALEKGYTPLPGGYVDKCHLCVDVRRRLAEAAHYPELAPRQFYDPFFFREAA